MMTLSKVILLLVFTSFYLCIQCAPATRTFIVKRYRVNADELNEVIPQSSRVIQDDAVLNAVMKAVKDRSNEEQSNDSSNGDDDESKFQSKVMSSDDDARYLGRQPLILPYPNSMAPGPMFPPSSHLIAPPPPMPHSPQVSPGGYQETTRVTTSHSSSSSSSFNNPHAPGFVRETSFKEIHRTSQQHPNVFNSGGNVPSSIHPSSWDRSSPLASTGEAQSNGDVFLSLTPPLVFSLNLG